MFSGSSSAIFLRNMSTVPLFFIFLPKQHKLVPRAAWLPSLFTMTTFDYSHQSSFRFCFVIEICQSRWGLKNNSPNLQKKTTNWRSLVVVVKWRHRAIIVLPCTILTSNFCTILTLHKTNVFQSWSTLVMKNKLWDLKQSKTEKKLWMNDNHNSTKNDTWFEESAIQNWQPIPRHLHKKIPLVTSTYLTWNLWLSS